MIFVEWSRLAIGRQTVLFSPKIVKFQVVGRHALLEGNICRYLRKAVESLPPLGLPEGIANMGQETVGDFLK